MIDDLNKKLKKYVTIFVNEYSDFLSIEQLEVLKSINYGNAIVLEDISKPTGLVSLGKIYLPKANELFNNFKNMPNYNSKREDLSNKNMASYLEYMCENGYSVEDYYNDILMYFIFKMVIKNSSGMINGLINQEMKYLSIKYSIRIANLYPREEAIVSRISPLIGMNSCRKIMFLDSASSYKYLNENYGYRVAKLVLDIDELIDNEYKQVDDKEYPGYNGFLNYTLEYDHILYGDAYNCILDFEVENSLVN